MKSGLPIVRPRPGFSAPDRLEVAASQGLGHWEMVSSARGTSFREPLSTEALSSMFVGSTEGVSFFAEPLSAEALSLLNSTLMGSFTVARTTASTGAKLKTDVAVSTTSSSISSATVKGGIRRNLAKKSIAEYLERQFSKAIPTIGVGLAAAILYAGYPGAVTSDRSIAPSGIRGWVDHSRDATWEPVASSSALRLVTASTDYKETARALEVQKENRATTVEQITSQIADWALMHANWDNEGAAAPVASSLKNAAIFVRLLGEDYLVPEPMLLASGHA